ncbi:Bgt-50688 [Blumeria graminis f. sp. tritici]|uniref:Bgt-50688 n=1 Tax=Blumeria graminis f. sp. tritici TaxID=62690 RepID=A0A9X9PSJ2_BLUGR|nr:Bgt-50688 [Blumeria graminis f. sp. tritici]
MTNYRANKSYIKRKLTYAKLSPVGRPLQSSSTVRNLYAAYETPLSAIAIYTIKGSFTVISRPVTSF